jgi:hypothetical protein
VAGHEREIEAGNVSRRRRVDATAAARRGRSATRTSAESEERAAIAASFRTARALGPHEQWDNEAEMRAVMAHQ